jgi:hypothetical protein
VGKEVGEAGKGGGEGLRLGARVDAVVPGGRRLGAHEDPPGREEVVANGGYALEELDAAGEVVCRHGLAQDVIDDGEAVDDQETAVLVGEERDGIAAEGGPGAGGRRQRLAQGPGLGADQLSRRAQREGGEGFAGQGRGAEEESGARRSFWSRARTTPSVSKAVRRCSMETATLPLRSGATERRRSGRTRLHSDRPGGGARMVQASVSVGKAMPGGEWSAMGGATAMVWGA